jgi:hypothetical protein
MGFSNATTPSPSPSHLRVQPIRNPSSHHSPAHIRPEFLSKNIAPIQIINYLERSLEKYKKYEQPHF